MWKITNIWSENISLSTQKGILVLVEKGKFIYLEDSRMTSDIHRLSKKGRIKLDELSSDEYAAIVSEEERLLQIKFNRHAKLKASLATKAGEPEKSKEEIKESKEDKPKKYKSVKYNDKTEDNSTKITNVIKEEE